MVLHKPSEKSFRYLSVFGMVYFGFNTILALVVGAAAFDQIGPVDRFLIGISLFGMAFGFALSVLVYRRKLWALWTLFGLSALQAIVNIVNISIGEDHLRVTPFLYLLWILGCMRAPKEPIAQRQSKSGTERVSSREWKAFRRSALRIVLVVLAGILLVCLFLLGLFLLRRHAAAQVEALQHLSPESFGYLSADEVISYCRDGDSADSAVLRCVDRLRANGTLTNLSAALALCGTKREWYGQDCVWTIYTRAPEHYYDLILFCENSTSVFGTDIRGCTERIADDAVGRNLGDYDALYTYQIRNCARRATLEHIAPCVHDVNQRYASFNVTPGATVYWPVDRLCARPNEVLTNTTPCYFASGCSEEYCRSAYDHPLY